MEDGHLGPEDAGGHDELPESEESGLPHALVHAARRKVHERGMKKNPRGIVEKGSAPEEIPFRRPVQHRTTEIKLYIQLPCAYEREKLVETGEGKVNGQLDGSTVLLSDADDAAALAAGLTHGSLPATCYPSVADLLLHRQLSSVSVLVLRFRPLPKGTLLANLGKMNLEFPWMQKLMVLDGPLPLPIAEYLTACGVDLIQYELRDEESADHLATVVNRLQERTQWLTPWTRSSSAWSGAAKEKGK